LYVGICCLECSVLYLVIGWPGGACFTLVEVEEGGLVVAQGMVEVARGGDRKAFGVLSVEISRNLEESEVFELRGFGRRRLSIVRQRRERAEW